VSTPPVIATPLRTEHAAVRRAVTGARVERTGRGPRRSADWVAARTPGPVLVAGVAGALQPGLRPGDLVVADEVTDGTVRIPVRSAELLAAALTRRGLRVCVGAVFCADAVATGAARRRLAMSGALAVDTESLVLAGAASAHPFAVVRAVVDTPTDPLFSPATISRGLTALRALRAAGPAIDEWVAALSTAVSPASVTPEEVS
jgi:4-hydroxy-3-methylbut-2-enyl diphosphate reductase